MDDDGLTISAKHVRDGIADWLGIDDGDKRLTWIVKQDKAPRGKHWVDVEVCVTPSIQGLARANTPDEHDANPEIHVKCSEDLEDPVQIPCGEAFEIEAESIEVHG